MAKKYLVTGAAGFIGSHVAHKLLARGDEVVGLDNLNEYYDVTLKHARLERLKKLPNFRFVKLDLESQSGMTELFAKEKFERVVHLAAQAGVRYSIDFPHTYINSNVTGTLNVLEGCRHNKVEHLVYASTSSVYGANTNMPFSVHNIADHPLSLYAATKRANELMAHNFSSLFKLPTTGLRFFTVYGPWGRPDMALFLFTKNILEGKPIDVFNHGHHKRDFTFVEDIAEGVVRASDRIAQPDPKWTATTRIRRPATRRSASTTSATTGRSRSCTTSRRSSSAWGRRRRRTCCRCSSATCRRPAPTSTIWSRIVGYRPATPVEEGVRRFVEWYLDYYGKR